MTNESVSIILTSPISTDILRSNLPSMLAELDDSLHEIIIVRETKKGDTMDILKPLMKEHQNLFSTYIPDKPQYISDNEVAVMLGVKAAKNENIIIIPPTFQYGINDIINNIRPYLTEKIIIGTPYHSKQSSLLKRLQRRFRLYRQYKQLCNDKGWNRSEITLPKNVRHKIIIAFRRNEYLNDACTRRFISNFTLV